MSNNNLKTTKRTFEIIEVMRNRDYMSLQEISAYVDTKKPNVHAHLNTLRECGYVIKKDHEYKLDLQFFSLGYDIVNGMTNLGPYNDATKRVSDETGYRSVIAVEENHTGYIIAESNGGASGPMQAMGRAFPMHSSAIGKAILAEYSDDQLENYIGQTIPSRAEHRDTESILKKDIDKIRETGISHNSDQGIIAMATAFHRGDRIFAIGADAPKTPDALGASKSSVEEVLLNVKSNLTPDTG
jgi:DNA-binding IclR family transcriptional regulator